MNTTSKCTQHKKVEFQGEMVKFILTAEDLSADEKNYDKRTYKQIEEPQILYGGERERESHSGVSDCL